MTENQLIVSLTSYPARIGSVPRVLESLLAQTVKPDRVVLCLSRENFPHESEDLPDSLKGLLARGVELLWCDGDLKPHKKYFYTMRKYPEATVVTVDDDWLYPPTMLAELLEAHRKFPNCICARWTRLMVFDEEGRPMPYRGWPHANKFFAGVPMLPLLPLTGSGVLYPPGLVPTEAFDASALSECALHQDDIWMRMMTLVRRVPVVTTGSVCEMTSLTGEGDERLALDNMSANDGAVLRTAETIRLRMGIDALAIARESQVELTAAASRCLLQDYSRKILTGKKRKDKLGEMRNRLEKAQGKLTKAQERLTKARESLTKTQEKLATERAQLRKLKSSRSYRLGRLLSWPLRKLKNVAGS